MRPIVIESDVAAASVVGISNNHNNCNKGTVSCFAPEVDVHETMQRLLAQEDTTNDKKITIDDKGPKRFCVKALDGTEFEVAGNQYISNLLQELALAAEQQQQGKTTLDLARIYENPVDRLSRMIKDYFWDGLTRTVDEDGIKKIVVDSKVGELGDSEDRSLASRPRIYVPYNDTEALEYFEQVARKFRSLNQFDLEVVRLPEHITPQYVKEINLRPGILCLAMRKHKDEVTGEETLKGVPFVVPGGRFNEMYGWDSYFESLGLIVDGRVEMAKNMVDNFVYQIKHYGKILNANRSYYLSRSQPPFLTSMALAVFEALEAQRQQQQAGGVEDGVINHNYHNHFNHHSKENLAWLRGVICTAINEYWQVWLNKDRYNPDNGLSRYHGEGKGIPPETEPTHFDHILQPYAEALGMTVREYAFKYINGEIEDEKLEEYFEHDRAVRESGHDTSYRLEAQCAHLNTVDLNSLLYKYEVDIARTIETLFGGTLEVPENGDSSTTTTTTTTTTTVYTSEQWYTRAERRKAMMHELMWDEETGFFYDYNFKTRSKTGFESATTFYALWAGVATPHQAQRMVERALPLLEAAGGLVGSTERSRGVVDAHRVPRQWDFPYGWAPHQMLAWVGLAAYGYEAEAQRLAYRWLYMIARNAADYNGTVPEKYDVVSRSHKCFVEYGNVGTEFDYITHEGFGWMNASFQVGLKRVLQPEQVKRLRELIPAEWLFGPSTVARDSTNFTNAAVTTTSHNNNNNNNDEYHSCS